MQVKLLSNLNCEYSDHADDSTAIVLNGDQTIRSDVPVGGNSWLDSSAIILLHDACYYVLGGLIEFCELFYAIFNDLLSPLVDFLSLVDSIWVYDTFDHVLNDLIDLRRVKVHVIFEFCHLNLLLTI